MPTLRSEIYVIQESKLMNAANRYLQKPLQEVNGKEAYVGQLNEEGLSIIFPHRGWNVDVAMQSTLLGGKTDIRVYSPDGSEVDLGVVSSGLTKATADNLRIVFCEIDRILNSTF